MTTIYFDLETGGLELFHPVIQFAAVAIDGGFRELEAIETKIRFNEADCTAEALAINHYDPEVWAQCAVPMEAAVVRIAAFMRRHRCVPKVSKTGTTYYVARLCGHNAAAFDGPRLRKMFSDLGVFFPGDLRIRDTLQRAFWWFDEAGTAPPDDIFKLGPLCEYFGIEIPAGEAAHDALTDVRLSVRLAQAMGAREAVPCL
jgi:DNA polymerase III epsilon subunit-like protein